MMLLVGNWRREKVRIIGGGSLIVEGVLLIDSKLSLVCQAQRRRVGGLRKKSI